MRTITVRFFVYTKPSVSTDGFGLDFYQNRQDHWPFLSFGKEILANVIANFIADIVGVGPREWIGFNNHFFNTMAQILN